MIAAAALDRAARIPADAHAPGRPRTTSPAPTTVRSISPTPSKPPDSQTSSPPAPPPSRAATTGPTAQPLESPAATSPAPHRRRRQVPARTGRRSRPLAAPKVENLPKRQGQIEARFANRRARHDVELRLLGYAPHSHRLARLRSRETNARSVVPSSLERGRAAGALPRQLRHRPDQPVDDDPHPPHGLPPSRDGDTSMRFGRRSITAAPHRCPACSVAASCGPGGERDLPGQYVRLRQRRQQLLGRSRPTTAPTTRATATARTRSAAAAGPPTKKAAFRRPTRSAHRPARHLAPSASWTFTAPTGTTITAIQYARYLGHYQDTSNYWSPALRADGTIVPGETCTVVFPDIGCGVGTQPPLDTTNTVDITGLSAGQLEFGEQCDAPTGQVCVTGASEHQVWAAMYGATVTLSDPTPPTLGTPTGVLWGTGPANGYHQGSESVIVDAQDVGGGVASIVLAVDGQTIQTYEASCDYTQPQPCPLSTGAQTLTLPTTQLADGAHTRNARRLRRCRQRVHARLRGDHGRQHRAGRSKRPLGDTDRPGGTDVQPRMDRPVGSRGADYERDLPGVPCKRRGRMRPADKFRESDAGDGDRAGNRELDGRGLAHRCRRQHQPRQRSPRHRHRPCSQRRRDHGQYGVNRYDRHDRHDRHNGKHWHNRHDGTGGTKPGKSKVHLSERLDGRRLTVTVKGSGSERVMVSYAAHWHGRLLAHQQRKITLRHGAAITVFVLSPTAARNAKITVTAAASHQSAVTSTLKRTSAR